MEELLELLMDNFPGIDWENEKNLIDSGVLDSVTMVNVITELEDHYDISVSMDYIQPKYFESAEAMLEMIEELA